MSDLNIDKVLANVVRNIAEVQEFDVKDITAGMKDGSLITSVTDDIVADPHFFYDTFQACITREILTTTLGYVLDCQENQPGGMDGQFALNDTKVNAIITDPTLGLMHLKPLLNDIELVCTDVDPNPFVGGGRHRTASIVALLEILGLTPEQYREQTLRVTLITFLGEHAYSNATLYILSSNNTRTVTPVEKSAIKMTSAAGVHFSDTQGVITAVNDGKVPVSVGLGMVANNVANEAETENLLTAQSWSILGKGFVSSLSKEKTPLFYVDGSAATTPKGEPKCGYTFEKLLSPSAFTDLVETFMDAVEIGLGQVILPPNVARDGVPILLRAAVEAVEDFELGDFYPDNLPLKVAKVKAVKQAVIKSSTALNLQQCASILDNSLPSSMKVADVHKIMQALEKLGGFITQTLTINAARSILEGKKPITALEAQAMLNGTAENEANVSEAQLQTIAKSDQQAVTVTSL